MLNSMWEAKTRFTVAYGTLSGTSEILAMIREGCDPTVLDYFAADHISEEEQQALIEMVFNVGRGGKMQSSSELVKKVQKK